VATGLFLAWFYYWTVEVDRALVINVAAPRVDFLSANLPLVLHARFLAQAILIVLMLTASLIDIDEKTIPDAITVPGALVGLAFAAIYPWSNGDWTMQAHREVEFLTLVSPLEWPPGLDPGSVAALAIGLGSWTLWCVGLLPRRWKIRRGLGTAMRVFWHRLYVERISYWIAGMWLVGAAAIGGIHYAAPRANWAALLTALVGMAAGGLVVWVVRVVGTAALRREAMGFGDVTLMAMIGAFVGWQAALVVFFLAPFMGLVLGIVERLAHGEAEIPYGPFLCTATLALIVQWVVVWTSAFQIFELGWLLPSVLAVCMVLMGLMLWVYRVALDRFGRAR
jgi:prepilin signal peptidase PulO-like enzyme (type II secretory pathway)